MKKISGGASSPCGFEASSAAAGIKYQGRDDMALLYSTSPCRAAGTFTSNIVKAAPVIWDRDIVEKYGTAQAVIINSGIANACTGSEGFDICRKTADEAGKVLNIDAEKILVASTGVIGMQIDIDRIQNGIRMMAGTKEHSEKAGSDAASAIMTTDTRRKEIAFEFELDGRKAVIGGMCKGSGMIHQIGRAHV